MGVKFEADNIYTLDSNGRMILTILASVAEEESHSKSIIMNWSIDRRFSRGLFLTPALLGYDKDEEGNLVINPEEAQTVKVIYYLYLNGYSLTEIATLLMEYLHFSTRVGWNIWTADYKYSTGGYLTAGALCRKLGCISSCDGDRGNEHIYGRKSK